MNTPLSAGPAPGSPPPPPPYGTGRPRQLRRRPDEGPIAGVCAGVAEYFNVDPVIVRIAAVVLAFSGPGIVAYILAWIFVPEATGPAPHPLAAPPTDRKDRGAQIFGIVLLAVSVSILWGGWWSPARRWFFPLGIMALGAWLLLRRDRGEDDPPTAPLPPAPSGEGDAPVTDITIGDDALTDEISIDETLEHAQPGEGSTGGGSVPPWSQGAWNLGPPPEVPELTAARRRRRMVFPIVMGALLLWTGIAALGNVSLQSGLAIALCIVGVGFVLGAFVGGSKALIVPAVLVGGALIASSIIDIPLSGPIGHRTWAPRRIAQIEDRYELSVGEGVLDLTQLPIEDGDRIDIDASIGVGHLVIEVPDGVAIDVTADASAGDVEILGQSDSGVGVSVERSFRGDPGAGTIDLNLEVGLGQIEVIVMPPHGRETTRGRTPTTAVLG